MARQSAGVRPQSSAKFVYPRFERMMTGAWESRPAMPPLIVLAFGALGGAVLVRWAMREAQRINQELEEARLARVPEGRRDERMQTLRRDPVTGVYRPN